MTKTANKHGLRNAAKAKRDKHAQRTPLPPRPGQVEAAKEEIQESKSWAKARAFAMAIKDHGWTGSFGEAEGIAGDSAQVTATRGNESIFIEWLDGVFQPTATYAMGDRVIRLRNASGAKKYACRTPEEGKEELERVQSNKAFRRRATPEEKLPRQRLPFDPAEASEQEIITAVLGRAVSWHNQYRETLETATVSVDPRRVYFTEWGGERILNWLCPATGFRACRVSAMMRVGRPAPLTAGRADNTVTMVESEALKSAAAAKTIKRKRVGR